MNYIKHLTGFFEKVAIDKTLNPTHVSLYMSLFQFWNCNRFKNPISISRDEVMRISKISSKATYHKCLRNLHVLGYINYEPSYNPFKGSHVFLFNFSADLKPIPKNEKTTKPKNELVFELVNEQAVNKLCTSCGTGTEQTLVSYINNTNIPNNLNIVNLDEQAKNFQIDDNFLKTDCTEKEKSSAKKEKEEMPEQLLRKNQKLYSPAFADYNAEQTEYSRQKSSAKKEEKEMPEDLLLENSKTPSSAFADYNAKHTENSRQKSSAKKEKDEIENSNLSSRAQSRERNPTIENVKSYFLEQNFPELEANKFFNYFSSVGWLVGGKILMVNWQAAAQNWMLNAIKFKSYEKPSDRAKHLNTATDKDYSEPL